MNADFEEDTKKDDSEVVELKDQKLSKQYKNDIVIITRPTVIKFPKYTRPITLLACGSAHILAMTD